MMNVIITWTTWNLLNNPNVTEIVFCDTDKYDDAIGQKITLQHEHWEDRTKEFVFENVRHWDYCGDLIMKENFKNLYPTAKYDIEALIYCSNNCPTSLEIVSLTLSEFRQLLYR